MKNLYCYGKIEEEAKPIEIRKRQSVDRLFLCVVIILLTLGTLMVYSAGYPYASSHYGDGAYYIKRQAVFLLIGALGMYFM